MERLYSRFPGGGVGAGLLLLRLIAAAWFLEIGIPMFGSNPIAFAIAVVLAGAGLSLVVGLRTSTNATLGACCSAFSLLLTKNPDQWFRGVPFAVMCISLALLGPGGFSLDARLSGWRTINLSSSPNAPLQRNDKETL
jgi:uncharacterized membrane protein YphA (DoxX/SURF4 family)